MFKATYQKVSFDQTKWFDKSEALAKVKVKASGRLFLKFAAPLIPIWTGESRASLLPLADYLNVKIDMSSCNINGCGYTGNAAGISRGKSQSASDGLSIKSTGIYYIELQRNVPHLADNDVNNMGEEKPWLIHETPWKSFEIGMIVASYDLKFNAVKGWPEFKQYIKFVKG